MHLKTRSSTRRRNLGMFIVLAILAAVTLGAWAMSSPVASSPDDNFHLASIWCSPGIVAGQCESAPLAADREVPSELVDGNCFAFKPEVSASCQGIDFGEKSQGLAIVSHGNFQKLYPPVFYAAMSMFVGQNITMSVLEMRLFNVAVFVIVMGSLLVLLPAQRRPVAAGAFVLTLVPLGMFIVPSTNPSGWAVISAGVLWLALLAYFETTGWRKVGLGVLAAIATLLGAGARADSAVYCGVSVVVVFILTMKRDKQYWFSAVLPVALVGLALYFYYSASQSLAGTSGLSAVLPADLVPVSFPALFFGNLLLVPTLWAGALGSWGLGWLDTMMPKYVWVITVAVFAAATVWGFLGAGRRKILAIVVVVFALWMLPTIVLVQSNVFAGTLVQPRYIYPLLVLLAGVALNQGVRKRVIPPPAVIWTALGLLAFAQAVALHTNIRRYVVGTGSQDTFNLDTHIEWWWAFGPSPMTVWLVGSVAWAGILTVAGLRLVRPSRSQLY